MMVAAASGAASTTDPQNPKAGDDNRSRRPPLLPSEKDNSNGVSGITSKRPTSRIVSSRYMSPSTSSSTPNASSRRYPSPLVSRNSTPVSNTPSANPSRSVSVDRRRPASARPLSLDLDSKNYNNATEVSAATKLLVTSTRRLSVSFQGEAFSLPVSKTKATPTSPNLSSVRKGTPERRRSSTPSRVKAVDGGGDQAENTKPVDQHRWPARNRLVNPLSRSLDIEKTKLTGSDKGIQALQRSMISEDRLNLDLGNSGNNDTSDTDSVSSGSTSGVQESGVPVLGRNGPRGMVVSARFWQETNTRLRRLQDPGSPLSTSPSSKLIAPPKPRKYPSDGPLSSPRMMSSPIRGGIRAASPNKLNGSVGSSPSRGISPSRVRNAVSTISNNFSETPSVLSFSVDVRRGKVGENRIFDAHLLRLLYNQHLQWRFVNARSEAVLLVQEHCAEKDLWNAWITISDLRDTVTKKRHRLQLLRQKLRLASILKAQMSFLEDWAALDKDHSISLLGAIEALKASTLRLPVVGGAVADVQSLKDAISSTVDVMQTMASSICSLLPRVEEVNSLVTQLAKVMAKERALLEQCTDFISTLAAIQVKETSLRTHMLQCNCVSRA